MHISLFSPYLHNAKTYTSFTPANCAISKHREVRAYGSAAAAPLILYCAVICAVRLMGKRQIGELDPSELVVYHSGIRSGGCAHAG